MARVKGATLADKAAHRFYDISLTCAPGWPGAHCRHCNAILLTAYHEERLYSVQCPNCQMVTLVKANNTASAALKVGLPHYQTEG